MHIGCLGGTFDPIHNGHLHLANSILNALPLDEIRLIPCFEPVHRDLPIATPAQRLTMTELACQPHPRLICDPVEIQRAGPSYTVDTLTALKSKQPEDTFYFIIGEDAFNSFTQWKDPQTLLSCANLIIVKRPNTQNTPKEIAALIEMHGVALNMIKSFSNGKLSLLEINALNISSTEVRKKLKKNADVTRIMPIEVYNFIKHEGLYAT